MKSSIILATLILAPMAHAAQSLVTAGAEVHAPAFITDSMVLASDALAHVSSDALDLATAYSRLAGISGTTAASNLNDLIADTAALKRSAVRLADLLDAGAAAKDIEKELDTLEAKYFAVTRGAAKSSTQLSSQGRSFEGYQLRTAYNKIRSRYVYLQVQLGE